MMMQAATTEPAMGMIDYAWKIGGPIAVVCLGLIYAVIFLFKKYDAEKTARIADARAYGKTQEDVNMVLLPTMARLAKRLQLLEGTGDSDRPPAMAVRESMIELGEETNKGPRK